MNEKQKQAYRRYLKKCTKYTFTLNRETQGDIVEMLDNAPNRTALICEALRLLDKMQKK